MSQFETHTDLTFEPIFISDESGAPAMTALCKATFDIGVDGTLSYAEAQEDILLEGRFTGEPGASSYFYEPETALLKSGSDVALVGSARSQTPVDGHLDVGLKVGGLQKVVRVFGDRWWVKQNGRIFASAPKPFTDMPLVYERSFGGWDKADKDEKNWMFEPRNPVGMGFGDPLRFVEEGRVRMPNIEDPQHPLRQYGDRPPPAGFGFISPHWEPRVGYVGTYDETWEKTRKPLLPQDFDRRFFNAASPGLVASEYLRGDEDVMVVNASPVPKLRFRLPGVPPPVCRVELRSGHTEVLSTNLDTVIVNTDEMILILLWRNYMVVPNGPHDVGSIEVTCERPLGAAAAR